MASDISQSSEALSREQSLATNGAKHDLNGDTHSRSHEPSDRDVLGNITSEDGDGDLFGDDGEEDAHIKPYAIEPFFGEQSNGGKW